MYMGKVMPPGSIPALSLWSECYLPHFLFDFYHAYPLRSATANSFLKARKSFFFVHDPFGTRDKGIGCLQIGAPPLCTHISANTPPKVDCLRVCVRLCYSVSHFSNPPTHPLMLLLLSHPLQKSTYLSHVALSNISLPEEPPVHCRPPTTPPPR